MRDQETGVGYPAQIMLQDTTDANKWVVRQNYVGSYGEQYNYYELKES